MVGSHGCGCKTVEERRIGVRRRSRYGILSTIATQSSPQLPRPNATRAILFNGSEILFAVT